MTPLQGKLQEKDRILAGYIYPCCISCIFGTLNFLQSYLRSSLLLMMKIAHLWSPRSCAERTREETCSEKRREKSWEWMMEEEILQKVDQEGQEEEAVAGRRVEEADVE